MKNILFLCTANLNRSRTAEVYFSDRRPDNKYKSAGLSRKYCKQYDTTLCTIHLLNWADIIFVMEPMHIERIEENVGDLFFDKIICLEIEDKYTYMDSGLVEKLKIKIEDLL